MHVQFVIASRVGRIHHDWEIEASMARRRNESWSSVRRAIGRRVIAVGRRIEAEPSLELAGSR